MRKIILITILVIITSCHVDDKKGGQWFVLYSIVNDSNHYVEITRDRKDYSFPEILILEPGEEFQWANSSSSESNFAPFSDIVRSVCISFDGNYTACYTRSADDNRPYNFFRSRDYTKELFYDNKHLFIYTITEEQYHWTVEQTEERNREEDNT